MWAAGTGVAATALLVPLVSAGPYATAEQRGTSRLQQQFADASEKYGVPESVLLGVSYLQSRWDTHEGAPSVSGGYGPMHLTDARTALAHSTASHPKTPAGAEPEDARGDTARPAFTPRGATAHGGRAAKPGSGDLPARLRTAERAAKLTGLSRAELRESPAANLRGGAALLAAAQRKLGHKLSSDPADWYGAVAAFPAASERGTATAFADDVFGVMRTGEQRTTDSGQRMRLPAEPDLRADRAQADGLGLSTRSSARSSSKAAAEKPECPRSVSCEWLPAPYEEYTDDDGNPNYGNHDKSRRPGSASIDYIVVHDTEGSWDTVMDLIQDPTYVSWNYSLRSSDGHIAQHVRNKDAAWHAGNWYVNAKSVGVEHEGFLTDPDAWFTEAMYRSSARLVRYIAGKYGIPLDRQHILGHDNVPGVTTDTIPGMHTDPGPYFDWRHYFRLLGEPFTRSTSAGGRLLTILPDYDKNRPTYTECDDSGKDCPAHGSGAVRLHTEPDAESALVEDAGLHPGGGKSTTGVNDTGARASTGQQYASAGRKGDWTAIWYLGQKAWFHNPKKQPTAVPSRGKVAVPKAGKNEIPVYGRAYPEKDAYPEGIPAQELSPLTYKIKAGQAYAVGLKTRGEYLYAKEFDPKAEKFKVVRGDLTYYQIQLGHRVAFVKADDVQVR
ncbi:N-acetylmuramoyl-L-alanine amidase [Streptomyces sp. HNM0575]|uniref:N-acetylmuramoyl-L-alanine amidase n=1 Tax=Streptomyces sp. HNM0575 TaxID=2716338 RepID=UPI001F0FD502|nr:N-acetylmuramoyl-L-alanine amidase [Streptomyces sp. HNM0575]